MYVLRNFIRTQDKRADTYKELHYITLHYINEFVERISKCL